MQPVRRHVFEISLFNSANYPRFHQRPTPFEAMNKVSNFIPQFTTYIEIKKENSAQVKRETASTSLDQKVEMGERYRFKIYV